MRYGLTVTSEPTVEPVDLDQVKSWVNQTLDDDDVELRSLVKAARQRAEAFTSRSFISTGWRMTMDCFPPVIFLPRSPVISVESVQYVNDQGNLTVLSSSEYQTDLANRQGRIMPAYGYSWPTIRPVLNAVQVNFTAGFGADAASVPESIKRAILLLANTWYDNREAVITGTIATRIPMSAEYLLGPYRAWP